MNRRGFRSATAVSDPVAVLPDLVDFLDGVMVPILVEFQDVRVEAALFDVLNDSLCGPSQGIVLEARDLGLDVFLDAIPHARLENREQHEDGDVVELIQDRVRIPLDLHPFEMPEAVILPESAAFGEKLVPVPASEAAHQSKEMAVLRVPGPGVIKGLHENNRMSMDSNFSRSSGDSV